MKPIRVLVVDDSAFARKVIRECLTAAGFEVVGTANDGLQALELIEQLTPEVVTLDLLMPNLDGVGVLKALAGKLSPRVVVVGVSDSDSELTVAALQAGAFDVVHKPTLLAVTEPYGMAPRLVEAVGAAGAALAVLLTALPADFPVPIALVLHIPPGYTAPFAKRLNEDCALEVIEADEGTVLQPGRVNVARAGPLASALGARRTKCPVAPSPAILNDPAVTMCTEGCPDVHRLA